MDKNKPIYWRKCKKKKKKGSCLNFCQTTLSFCGPWNVICKSLRKIQEKKWRNKGEGTLLTITFKQVSIHQQDVIKCQLGACCSVGRLQLGVRGATIYFYISLKFKFMTRKGWIDLPAEKPLSTQSYKWVLKAKGVAGTNLDCRGESAHWNDLIQSFILERGNWGSERVSSWLKTTQPDNVKARTWTLVPCLLHQFFFFFFLIETPMSQLIE